MQLKLHAEFYLIPFDATRCNHFAPNRNGHFGVSMELHQICCVIFGIFYVVCHLSDIFGCFESIFNLLLCVLQTEKWHKKAFLTIAKTIKKDGSLTTQNIIAIIAFYLHIG